MTATDASAAVFGTLFSLLLTAGFYIWVSLALAAVFRKSGVEPWKAWIPIFNTIVLLQLAGLSPWLILLALIPILGQLAFLVVFAIAIYRLSVAFGFGAGMTVLGILVVPVWASIIGWGSARWVGNEADAGVRRTPDPSAWPTPLMPSPALLSSEDSSAFGSWATPGYASAAQATFGPAPSTPAYATPDAAVPPLPEAPAAALPPIPPVPPAPAAPAASAVSPPPGGWTPPPLPAEPSSARAARATVEGAFDVDETRDAASFAALADASHPKENVAPDVWEGGAIEITDLTGEVTGAVSGAPAPISAVPSLQPPVTPVSADGPLRGRTPYTPEADIADTGVSATPPVTRVPAPGSAPGDERDPWVPARTPMSDPDAFPEASAEVSAVAGAPDAGAPRSARSSVSAFHAKPEIPDDVIDETVIARRRRTDWSLVPPTGDPVPLSAETVILGRRPAADPAHPGAQLISIQDGTVSKTHARLQLRDDRWYVTDLDSTNGVFFATLMGTEVEATPGVEVEAGDRFLLGDAEIRLQRSEA